MVWLGCETRVRLGRSVCFATTPADPMEPIRSGLLHRRRPCPEWSDPFRGRVYLPLWSSAFHGALLTPDFFGYELPRPTITQTRTSVLGIAVETSRLRSLTLRRGEQTEQASPALFSVN